MKKTGTYIMLLTLASVTFVSCGSSRNSAKSRRAEPAIGTTVIKTVATAVGVILLAKLIKSVLNTIGGSTVFGGTTQKQSFMANFNEDTKLSSFANNDLMKAALQVLVADQYKIRLATVAQNYSSFNTAGDLATFIGKNADAKILMQIK